MSDNRQNEKKRSAPRYAMLGGIGTALAIVNIMSNGGEAQSQPVLILEYTALALGLIALVGGLIMMMANK